MTESRLLVISPVRNEAPHIERVVRAMAAQTRPPEEWIIVDDGSSDATPGMLARLEPEVAFMRLMATPPDFTVDSGDRHAVAAAPRAFNLALGSIDWTRFTHIAKLDGDIELSPDYFERLLAEFARDPALGIAGGTLEERQRGEWRLMRGPEHHVRGALKLYSRDCFIAIGGMQERLAWDGIDETYARMRGFSTRSFQEIVARHHRETGAADGRLRGHVRWGEAHYITHFDPAWVALRSVKVAARKPYGVSGLAYLYGYARAAARRVPRVEDAEYRRFVRRDLRRRLLHPFRIQAG